MRMYLDCSNIAGTYGDASDIGIYGIWNYKEYIMEFYLLKVRFKAFIFYMSSFSCTISISQKKEPPG